MTTLNNPAAKISMTMKDGLLSVSIAGLSISLNPRESKKSIYVLETLLGKMIHAKYNSNIDDEAKFKLKLRNDLSKLEAVLDIISLYKGEFECEYTITTNGNINTKFNGDIDINIISIVNQLLKLEE